MRDWKNNVSFVLVGPKEPGNIGSSARAMKNMDFKNLVLVNPPDKITNEARWMAHNAEDVLDGAMRHDDLKSALLPMSLVAGTTRRRGMRRGSFVDIEEGARRLYDAAIAGNNVAVLFGSEDRGLSNADASRCDFLMHIPASRQQPSLNLSHAVILTAYEISMAAMDKNAGKMKLNFVPRPEIEMLYARLYSALESLGYTNRLCMNITEGFRRYIGRTGLTKQEFNMLLGICVRIEKKFKDLPGSPRRG